MDYEFLSDITGDVMVRCSMGHEALAQWVNEEVKGNLALLDEIKAASIALKGTERQYQHIGHEYTLFLDDEEVMIRANQLNLEGDELESDMRYYDEESMSFCGLEDFFIFVEAYRTFIGR